MDDDQFLEIRRRADQREFLIQALDVANAPRLAPALLAVRERLSGGGWVPWVSVLASGVRASDVAVKTVDTQIRNAVLCGLLERRGEYMQATRSRSKVDTRELRLVDWPDPS